MKTCAKCSYTRMTADARVPDWQCPKCGVAYAKFETQQVANWEAKRASPPVIAQTRTDSSSSRWITSIVVVVALCAISTFAGYGPTGWLKFVSDVRSERTKPSQGPSHLPVLQMSQEASEGLAQLTPSRVVFFSTSWCPHCATVRNLLHKQGMRFTELDVERDARAAAFQREKMPVVGFPVTVIGSQIVMGSDESAILAALKSL